MAARRGGVGSAALAMELRLAGTGNDVSLPLIDRVDAALGDGIETAMIRHPIRRLRRHGQLGALAPASAVLGSRAATSPREGNSLEGLIDGASALPEMAE